jgi:hypothetical protein
MLRNDNKLWLSNYVTPVTVAPKASVLTRSTSHISDGDTIGHPPLTLSLGVSFGREHLIHGDDQRPRPTKSIRGGMKAERTVWFPPQVG